jgi:hypothetical protein
MSRRRAISVKISCANNATCFEGIALTEKPTGVRELGVPFIGPAVANALAALGRETSAAPADG